ncbi:hypothetical protein B0A49_11017 [Cryomyces minteri]|uniref:Uncharacterized protein n=1 Tax=Cryomyces minteri TaxID=331657 RepID=A0A4U0WLB7_9PEZI|nr:hypothetical protein B0A49_11017 [Cryomyces minteri]
MSDRNTGGWRYYEECEDLPVERRYAPYGQSEPPRFWTAGVHPTDPPVLRSLHDPTSSPRAAAAVGPALQQPQSGHAFPAVDHGSPQTAQRAPAVSDAGPPPPPPPPFDYGPSPTSYHPRPSHHHHHHSLPVSSHALRPGSAPPPVRHSGLTHPAHSIPDASRSAPRAGTLPQGFALFPQRHGSPRPRPLYPDRNPPDNGYRGGGGEVVGERG